MLGFTAMKSQLQSWRKKIKGHPISSIVIFTATIIGIALIVVIILGYYFDWDWTGLGPYTTLNRPKTEIRVK